MKHALEAAAVFAFLFACIAFRNWFTPPQSPGRSQIAIRHENIRQFSVRSLLIVTTLVAVVLAMGVWLGS